MALRDNLTPEKVTMSIMAGMLAVTGIGMFIWMWADMWQDSTGIVIASTFVALALLQITVFVLWSRYEGKEGVDGPSKKMLTDESQEMLEKSAASN